MTFWQAYRQAFRQSFRLQVTTAILMQVALLLINLLIPSHPINKYTFLVMICGNVIGSVGCDLFAARKM